MHWTVGLGSWLIVAKGLEEIMGKAVLKGNDWSGSKTLYDKEIDLLQRIIHQLRVKSRLYRPVSATQFPQGLVILRVC